jgi:hypothetical protein
MFWNISCYVPSSVWMLLRDLSCNMVCMLQRFTFHNQWQQIILFLYARNSGHDKFGYFLSQVTELRLTGIVALPIYCEILRPCGLSVLRVSSITALFCIGEAFCIMRIGCSNPPGSGRNFLKDWWKFIAEHSCEKSV